MTKQTGTKVLTDVKYIRTEKGAKEASALINKLKRRLESLTKAAEHSLRVRDQRINKLETAAKRVLATRDKICHPSEFIDTIEDLRFALDGQIESGTAIDTEVKHD